MSYTSPEPKKFCVRVEVDRVSRDETEIDVIMGVTHIDVSVNGDLLLHQEEQFPAVGYGTGVWLSFEVRRKEEE